ncbi:MAG: YdeI/OmpD-associated family protein [Chryseolinea sp.]
MISFSATIQKFDKKGEKTGWSFIEISRVQAEKLMPGQKVSFRVKGSIDSFSLAQTALLPMGDGNFILPMNATIRKAIGKKHGDKVKVLFEADKRKFQISPHLMRSLRDKPGALDYFQSLAGSHQKYFSKWIDGAKTAQTKTRRIVMAVIALSKHQGYPEMIRSNKKELD